MIISFTSLAYINPNPWLPSALITGKSVNQILSTKKEKTQKQEQTRSIRKVRGLIPLQPSVLGTTVKAETKCTIFSLPRKVRRSLRSIADPKLSIKSRFENPPLWQYSDKNLRTKEPCLEKFYSLSWSAICFKIRTQYTCSFFCLVYMQSFQLGGFFPQVGVQFLLMRPFHANGCLSRDCERSHMLTQTGQKI